jgi:hypothetical protein
MPEKIHLLVHEFLMHQVHNSNKSEHGGMMALTGVKWHTCKNEPEVIKLLPEICSGTLSFSKDNN